MTRINLLPWREQRQRVKEQRLFLLFSATAMAAIWALVASHYVLDNRIRNQEARNHYLETQIQLANTDLEAVKNVEQDKKDLLARMEIIQNLQNSRNETVVLLDQLTKALPNGIQYTRVVRKGDTITIEGLADSNDKVSTLMRNLEASPWLDTPTLSVIDARNDPGSKKSQGNRFTLSVTTTPAEARAKEAS